MLNIEWLGKVWFQSTEWQRSLNGKLRAQRLVCTLFEIGELRETSVEKILTFWGYQIHYCSLSQEREKTHSETCTIQALCIGEKSCSLSSRKKKNIRSLGTRQMNLLIPERRASSSCNVSSPLYWQTFTSCQLAKKNVEKAQIHFHRAGCEERIWS